MNVNDYGVLIVYGVGVNISGYTGLTMIFDRPDGTVLTVTSPSVTTSTNPIVVPGQGTFLAAEYAEYTFKPGDVTVAGTWSVRLVYDAPNVHLTSDATTFVVGP